MSGTSVSDVGLPDLHEQDIFFETNGLRILTALRRIIRAVDIHSRKLKAEFNATGPQLLCLYSLVRGGPATLTALAGHVNLSVSTVNGIVDRLETKGWAKRNRSVEDRRKVFVEVTEQGREVTRRAPSLLQDRLSEKVRALTELEQVAIALTLERVVELMEAEHIDASPNLLSSNELGNDKGGPLS
ncbi:MAG: MarR family transcriptional regulator [Candidatus Hydrogenedentes bacterium]|nr:MarR family transcriptional regulator [Candidatus Hydrogenedentota bacterium]